MTKTSPESFTGSQGSSHFNVAGACRNTVDPPFDGSACLFRHGDERFAGPNDNRRLQVHPTSVAHGAGRQQTQSLSGAEVDLEDRDTPPGLDALQVETPEVVRRFFRITAAISSFASCEVFYRRYLRLIFFRCAASAALRSSSSLSRTISACSCGVICWAAALWAAALWAAVLWAAALWAAALWAAALWAAALWAAALWAAALWAAALWAAALWAAVLWAARRVAVRGGAARRVAVRGGAARRVAVRRGTAVQLAWFPQDGCSGGRSSFAGLRRERIWVFWGRVLPPAVIGPRCRPGCGWPGSTSLRFTGLPAT